MKASFVYTGIRVRDLDRSIEFYTKVLGMTVTGRQRIPAVSGEVASLVSPGGKHELELNFYEKGTKFDTPYVVGEGMDHLAFHVEDFDNAVREAEAAGHPVVLKVDTGKSRWVYIQDPDGNYIEFVG